MLETRVSGYSAGNNVSAGNEPLEGDMEPFSTKKYTYITATFSGTCLFYKRVALCWCKVDYH